MKRALVAAAAALLAITASGLAITASGLAIAAPQSKNANGVPRYVVDPFWPKDLPENWTLGQVAGIAVDNQDNVWIVHRPRTLVDDEKGARRRRPRRAAASRHRPCCSSRPMAGCSRAGAAPARATTGPSRSTASTSTRRATSGSPATTRTITRS